MSKKDSVLEKSDSGTTVTEETTKSSTNGSEQLSEWVSKPEDVVPIDDAFWIKRQGWGTYVSVLKDGSHLITSLTEEQCAQASRWYLKARQEGFEDVPTHEGVVGGKL